LISEPWTTGNTEAMQTENRVQQFILHSASESVMVIGRGLLGTAFQRYAGDEQILLFCSGVSNSGCTSHTEFEREQHLLEEALRIHSEKVFVYFSTCSVYDPTLCDRPYVLHKLKMEQLVRQHTDHLILRLSNLVGRTDNPYTILNYFYKAIDSGIPFELWQYAERNLIDIEDVLLVCDFVLKQKLFINQTLQIANPISYPVTAICLELEKHLNKKGHYILVGKGAGFHIPLNDVLPLFEQVKLVFPPNYLKKLLNKYYPQ